MPHKANFDPETIKLMGQACDEAWHDLKASTLFSHPGDEAEMRNLIARRVMAAVTEGERSLEQLKAAALIPVTS